MDLCRLILFSIDSFSYVRFEIFSSLFYLFRNFIFVRLDDCSLFNYIEN